MMDLRQDVLQPDWLSHSFPEWNRASLSPPSSPQLSASPAQDEFPVVSALKHEAAREEAEMLNELFFPLFPELPPAGDLHCTDASQASSMEPHAAAEQRRKGQSSKRSALRVSSSKKKSRSNRHSPSSKRHRSSNHIVIGDGSLISSSSLPSFSEDSPPVVHISNSAPAFGVANTAEASRTIQMAGAPLKGRSTMQATNETSCKPKAKRAPRKAPSKQTSEPQKITPRLLSPQPSATLLTCMKQIDSCLLMLGQLPAELSQDLSAAFTRLSTQQAPSHPLFLQPSNDSLSEAELEMTLNSFALRLIRAGELPSHPPAPPPRPPLSEMDTSRLSPGIPAYLAQSSPLFGPTPTYYYPANGALAPFRSPSLAPFPPSTQIYPPIAPRKPARVTLPIVPRTVLRVDPLRSRPRA